VRDIALLPAAPAAHPRHREIGYHRLRVEDREIVLQCLCAVRSIEDVVPMPAVGLSAQLYGLIIPGTLVSATWPARRIGAVRAAGLMHRAEPDARFVWRSGAVRAVCASSGCL